MAAQSAFEMRMSDYGPMFKLVFAKTRQDGTTDEDLQFMPHSNFGPYCCAASKRECAHSSVSSQLVPFRGMLIFMPSTTM